MQVTNKSAVKTDISGMIPACLDRIDMDRTKPSDGTKVS